MACTPRVPLSVFGQIARVRSPILIGLCMTCVYRHTERQMHSLSLPRPRMRIEYKLAHSQRCSSSQNPCNLQLLVYELRT